MAADRDQVVEVLRWQVDQGARLVARHIDADLGPAGRFPCGLMPLAVRR